MKVLIPSGSYQRYADDLVGKTVGFVRSTLEADEVIASQLSALVNGRAVSDDYVLSRGELLEFVSAGDAGPATDCAGEPS